MSRSPLIQPSSINSPQLPSHNFSPSMTSNNNNAAQLAFLQQQQLQLSGVNGGGGAGSGSSGRSLLGGKLNGVDPTGALNGVGELNLELFDIFGNDPTGALAAAQAGNQQDYFAGGFNNADVHQQQQQVNNLQQQLQQQQQQLNQHAQQQQQHQQQQQQWNNNGNSLPSLPNNNNNSNNGNDISLINSPNDLNQAQQQQQQQQQQPRTLIAQAVPSPFLLNYLVASPVIAAGVTATSLTAEQQQRLYADFVAGKNINSFNALPPHLPTPTLAPMNASHSLINNLQLFTPAGTAAATGAIGTNASATGGYNGMGDSDSEDDSEDDDSPPNRGTKRKLKTGADAAQPGGALNAQYYQGLTKEEFDSMGGDPNDRERLGKRLARKAELARASRRRKKMYVQDLEGKVKKLTQKIDELQAKANSNRAKAPTHVLLDEDQQRKSAQQTIRATMSALLSRPEGVDGPADQQRIHDLVRQFVENSRDRQSQVETYLDRVEESLTPGLQAKFAMWGLDQNDDFYTKPGLWTSLMSKEIGLTPTQLANILSKRPQIHSERKNMAKCELMIKELRGAAGQHLRGMHQVMDEIQNIMTPIQLAKFYLWVENNEWTMQMLNSTLGFSSSSTARAGSSQQLSQQAAAAQSSTSP